VSARVGVLVFPGTNSEDETVRILRDVGADAESVHWSRADALGEYDAYVLPGGFAYEDRVRAGAIAAHDRMMEYVLDGAQRGKLVLGICNGAQILLEAGVVPGTGESRRATAAFTHNAQRHFICRHVEIRLAVEPSRSPITRALDPDAVIPAWAAHGQGRLAASEEHLREIADGALVAFTYAGGAPNGSALDAAGLLNREGNVLALMPHPERDAWNFQHLADSDGDALALSGGAAFFRSFAAALR
jgi:phosphoribosylformylglycinamidine synthase I